MSFLFSKKNLSAQSGFGLVEVLVGAALILLIYTSLIRLYAYYISHSLDNTEYVQVSSLLEEGVEAVKTLRDYSWSSQIALLGVGTSYHLYWNTAQNRWTATTTTSLIDGFDRTLSLASVSRDGSSNIVSSGGTVDANARLLTVTLSWFRHNATTTRTLQTYIFNISGN